MWATFSERIEIEIEKLFERYHLNFNVIIYLPRKVGR